MRKLISSFAMILGACAIAGARDAAMLKADLQSMLPSGKTSVRLAWIKGGSFQEFAMEATATAVYVAGSEDGVIRRLYPASSTGNYCNVSISADGSRVFFLNRASGRPCVINWDGTGFRELSLGGMLWEYWRNPADGSDWALVNKNGTTRVNIDNPSQQVRVAGSHPGDGAGLSDDGKKCLGYQGGFGLWDVATMKWTAGGAGCQGSMRAGNSYNYGHNNSGHGEWVVHDGTGAQIASYKTATTISSWLQSNGQKATCYQWPTAEASRFTQHPDFMTLQIAQSKVNPLLVRLPDLKFVYIEDNLPCTFCGDMDAVFLSSGGQTGVSGRKPADIGMSARWSWEAGGTYSPDGRRLSGAPAMRGVIIRSAGNGAVGVSRQVILP